MSKLIADERFRAYDNTEAHDFIKVVKDKVNHVEIPKNRNAIPHPGLPAGTPRR